jgi:hypothetical protein
MRAITWQFFSLQCRRMHVVHLWMMFGCRNVASCSMAGMWKTEFGEWRVVWSLKHCEV